MREGRMKVHLQLKKATIFNKKSIQVFDNKDELDHYLQNLLELWVKARYQVFIFYDYKTASKNLLSSLNTLYLYICLLSIKYLSSIKTQDKFAYRRMRKDQFEFYKQSQNYQKYRPKYSHNILNAPIKQLVHKNRYLDVAVGTGQILFQLYSHFPYSKGIDISPKMLSVCEEKLLKLKSEGMLEKNSIQFQKVDFNEKSYGQDEGKYDLITIGQALHWLPIRQSLMKMSRMVEKDGVVAIYGYILKGVIGQNQEETDKIEKASFEFYEKRVKGHFNYDRDELHKHYSQKDRYPFEQVFSSVERIDEEISLVMPGSHFLSYLQTISGYTTYLQNNQDDPIKFMEEVIPAEKQFQVNFDYFAIFCRN